MNARLNYPDPDELHRQTETCSAIAFLFLETSSQYFDLQIGAARSSLDSFRSHCDLLEPSANGTNILAGYKRLFAQSLDAGSQLLRESVTLSSGSQQQFGQLMDEGWAQWTASSQKTINAQLRLLSRLCQPLAKTTR